MQWYPGHMKRAKKDIKKNLKLVDKVIYLLDARIPASTRNQGLEKLFKDKEVIVVLNKKDLAAKELTQSWLEDLREEFETVVAINSLSGSGVKKLIKLAAKEENSSKQSDLREKTRLMIVGMPNVGKSQLINSLLKRKSAKTGNTPGVTRGKQWIRVDDKLELLDLPGILFPQLEDKERGAKLAACSIIKESIFDSETVAYFLIDAIKEQAVSELKERFKLDSLDYQTYDLIAEMGRKRGCLQAGGRIDRERISNIIINEYQKGEFGRVSLEKPKLEADNNEVR